MASPPIQDIQVWRRAAFDGLVFYRGTKVDHPYPRHWHDEVHLCLYTAGTGFLGYRGNSHRVVSGDFLLTPAGEVHWNWIEPRTGTSVSYRSAYIEGSLLRNLAAEITGHDREPDFSSLRIDSPRAKRGFLRMHRAMESSDSALAREELLIESLGGLISECSHLAGEAKHSRGEKAVVQRARRYIDLHFAEQVSLAQLARVAQLSRFHLHRIFCEEIGMPPHCYQTQVRVNRAKELLRRRVDLPEIALTTGFADQSHFTRHFRRLVGVTPGRFKRECHSQE